jgi:hypothetical protein
VAAGADHEEIIAADGVDEHFRGTALDAVALDLGASSPNTSKQRNCPRCDYVIRSTRKVTRTRFSA